MAGTHVRREVTPELSFGAGAHTGHFPQGREASKWARASEPHRPRGDASPHPQPHLHVFGDHTGTGVHRRGDTGG